MKSSKEETRLHKIMISIRHLVLVSCLFLVLPLMAQITPLTPVPADDTKTSITCELTVAPNWKSVPVLENQNEADSMKGTYHYELWLPIGYNAAPTKAWPCIFIMSPRGPAKMKTMKPYFEAHGFIVVVLDEARNGPWEPIVGNFLAAHDDVVKRVRVADGQKYATGFSGGARGSSVFVQLRPGFRGLLLQGAGLSSDKKGNYHASGIVSNSKLHVAMTIGNADGNKVEVPRVKQLMGGGRCKVFEFEGAHEWAPTEVFEKAMASLDNKETSSTAAGASLGVGEPLDVFKKK